MLAWFSRPDSNQVHLSPTSLSELPIDKRGVVTDCKRPFIYDFAFCRVWIIHPKLTRDTLIFGMDRLSKKAAVAVARSIVESHIWSVMFG